MQLIRGLPDNAAAIELLTSTAVGAFRLEIEVFLDQQPERNKTWNNIKTHMLSCFVRSNQQEYYKGLLAQVKQMLAENIRANSRCFCQAASEVFPGNRNMDQN